MWRGIACAARPPAGTVPSRDFAIYIFKRVTTKVARLETTKKRKSFEILGVLSVFAPLW